jgi:hypothetical protein
MDCKAAPVYKVIDMASFKFRGMWVTSIAVRILMPTKIAAWGYPDFDDRAFVDVGADQCRKAAGE